MYDPQYSTSWDWLIPVLDKIYKDCNILVNNSIMPYMEAVRPIKKALLNLNLNELYNAIIQFIKWYDETTNIKNTEK